ncbi:eukaryotic translation initiation factor 2A-like [Ptychodera flava]|uniref:eukaryotic translation initiation factor 2A-like n=1 Tax=Ptychodera flava TaxID=63121 RepID=UPI00396A7656
MAAPCPLLAVRGSAGTSLFQGPPVLKQYEHFPSDTSPRCKVLAYSEDGSLFAWCNGQSVNVIELPSCNLIQRIDRPKTVFLQFSPRNNILATWEPYAVTKDTPAGTPNLYLWDLRTGQSLKGFVQKRQDTWCPKWSSDESICSRNVNNEIHFFENNNFDTIARKLHIQKVVDFRLSPGEMPCKVATYVPGSKGAPSFVRVYKYPNLEGPGSTIANKSFFKADRVSMLWNKKGTDLLIITTTDVDQTGASYYGEQTLHYISTKGETSVVPLAKKGPIYSVDWNVNSTEFCVVYGFMPAKATLFNLKCEPVFDFGTGPRNTVHFNPQGSIICLAGFGNLRGNIEFWDRKNFKNISKMTASDSTYFEWSPDGEHILTATCSPRLRVGNGFKIWHYTGSLLHETEVSELWEVTWQKFLEGVLPEKAIVYKAVPSAISPSKPEPKAAAYVPPALRGQPHKATSLHIRDEELPQNMKPKGGGDGEQLSKSALKNKKKREAKAKAKQEADHMDGLSQEKRDAIAMAAYVMAPAEAAPQVQNTYTGESDPEKEKKIKGIRKKLKQIEKLKEQQASGKSLEKNQLEKLTTEDALLQELEELML